ncbi:uncharacterized protein LOC113460331 [Zonotrichia albicollis]|uniref:uncharacterized protein LOC113460331 n=1 Tax=Zonotrichia albicollis TaxID=44394 RepID=UPI003D80BD32
MWATTCSARVRHSRLRVTNSRPAERPRNPERPGPASPAPRRTRPAGRRSGPVKSPPRAPAQPPPCGPCHGSGPGAAARSLGRSRRTGPRRLRSAPQTHLPAQLRGPACAGGDRESGTGERPGPARAAGLSAPGCREAGAAPLGAPGLQAGGTARPGPARPFVRGNAPARPPSPRLPATPRAHSAGSGRRPGLPGRRRALTEGSVREKGLERSHPHRARGAPSPAHRPQPHKMAAAMRRRWGGQGARKARPLRPEGTRRGRGRHGAERGGAPGPAVLPGRGRRGGGSALSGTQPQCPAGNMSAAVARP